MAGSKKIGRSAITGKFVPVKTALAHPKPTVFETISKKRTKSR